MFEAVGVVAGVVVAEEVFDAGGEEVLPGGAELGGDVFERFARRIKVDWEAEVLERGFGEGDVMRRVTR